MPPRSSPLPPPSHRPSLSPRLWCPAPASRTTETNLTNGNGLHAAPPSPRSRAGRVQRADTLHGVPAPSRGEGEGELERDGTREKEGEGEGGWKGRIRCAHL